MPAFTIRVPVRWGDQDALGHVNNAAYLTYIEQARIEFLAGLAPDGAPWPGPEGQGPVLAAADVRFLRPVHYPATVTVSVVPEAPGRTSLVLRHTVAVEGGAVACEATTRLVWVDHATGRPTPLPDALRRALP